MMLLEPWTIDHTYEAINAGTTPNCYVRADTMNTILAEVSLNTINKKWEYYIFISGTDSSSTFLTIGRKICYDRFKCV